jgi:phage-related minor tail protein
MVRQIILKLYEQLVVQQMVNAAMGVVGSVFPALAPALSGFKAMGGPVTSGQPYMVGERGPEIIVPSRNGTVVPNSQLGGGGVTVVQNINITTGVQQTVRAEIKSLMPQIADSAKAAVLDARRRGGSYGSAFA